MTNASSILKTHNVISNEPGMAKWLGEEKSYQNDTLFINL